jgi:phage terminase large subunit-like protein
MRGTWNNMFLDEAEAFPNGGHDDMVDTAAYAYNILANVNRKPRVGHLH